MTQAAPAGESVLFPSASPSPVGKIVVGQAFADIGATILVHMVNPTSPNLALCGTDVEAATWVIDGEPCLVCDHLEDVQWYSETGRWPGGSIWDVPGR
jgi:hypothetical protein